MSRASAVLPAGTRLTDYISLGVFGKSFPVGKVNKILFETGKTSQRQRDLPAHVVVYYVIALALFMGVSYREVLRCLLEGLEWLTGMTVTAHVSAKSAISQARTRLGVEPLRRLHDETVMPIATPQTRGAWYGHWRLVSLDGSTLEVADTQSNAAAFGRPGASRGKSAFPQLRLVSLVENGTHVLFGSHVADYHTGEVTLAKQVLGSLTREMLCLADRNFFGHELWRQSRETGAHLVWRIKKNQVRQCLKRLKDGSYLGKIYPSQTDRRHDSNAISVRVIEYTLEGVEDAEPLYRIATSILNPDTAPAHELAALYHQRWEIESSFDELKTHLRGARIVLRSKTPDLVRQEFYGFLLAHFAIRGLMHEAALEADVDPDTLSFVHTVRVVRRKLPKFLAFPPSGEKTTS
jgi:hypothetical protein